jgi:6-pyruvoyltetrahydropterin/6-carboxytetrahydropterin synthase
VFRLTREVRFAVNVDPADDARQLAGKPLNAYAGYPALLDLAGRHVEVQVTLAAATLDPASQYLRNIKDVDDVVRRRGIPVVAAHVRDRRHPGGRLVAALSDALSDGWPGARLERLRLVLTPYLAWERRASEPHPMVRLSQTFEFSAAHRLHNPSLSDAENRTAFGKCNNPLGHGHNYLVQVTLAGEVDDRGTLVDLPAFERIVAETVINRFDHKHLNLETIEFRDTIPSVENIAKVIHDLLKPRFASERGRLASVTVWETPKTWCEYGE